MEEVISLLAGIAILALAFCDFFYTTLSGSGAGYLSKPCATITHKLILYLERKFSRKVYSISGLAVNLAVLSMWVLLIWLGLFLVYSSNPEAIVNNSGRQASAVERIYFTGYVLSTLGVGNYQPKTPSFEILTSVFSFFGFVFFSTSMTYLLSISSAVVQKRSLALSIRSLGGTPAEIVKRLLEVDMSFGYQQISNLQQMVHQHSVLYQAYPVLHFYHSTDNAVSLSINLTRLDEALSIMLHSSKFDALHEELQSLRGSITLLLKHLESRFGTKAGEKPAVDWYELQLPESVLQEGFSENPDLSDRRKVLTSLLRNENRSWKDVYPDLDL
ncbi:hypothetical protein DXT99_25995 [Pontibacter diazotrophicus]|uniref:Potassium channel domain-containing protein n=1 Tax=Pontibacter diazotrophicus TaxID=1400979 RepID=A0A3D8L014_9BACT|nr:ion channel [Pontibacter diazotrophicus]RDV10720.1 hypothetical protein DXT99_25995 [Pontibacter diazotrophicus]